MKITLLAALAALSLAAATANAASGGTAGLGTGDPFPVRAPGMAVVTMVQASTQQAVNSSSGRIIQPAGVGNRRETLSLGQRQTFDRDFAATAGVGCGLLCRAGIQ